MASLPSTPFTDIDSTRVAVDAPVSTDLMTDIVVDLNYLKSFIANFGVHLLVFSTAGDFPFTAIGNAVTVEMWGAGGSGSVFGGAGGGAGAYVKTSYSTTVGTIYNVHVGAGGIAMPDSNGQDGENTWFGVLTQKANAGKGAIRAFNGGPATGGLGGAAEPFSSTLISFKGLNGQNGDTVTAGNGGDVGIYTQGIGVPGLGGVGSATPTQGNAVGGGGVTGGYPSDGSADGADGLVLLYY